MRYRVIKKWRTLAALMQGAVLLGLPFITINGNSALRFDIPSQRLYFFGSSLAMDEFFILLLALLFLTFLFIALTMLYGRLWCGWACPQTVLADLTGSVDRARGAAQKILISLPVLALSALVSADIIWYFVPPHEFIALSEANSLVRTIWLVLAVIIFIDLMFIRRVFCSTVCPYARLQSVLYDDRTMVIAYDPALSAECMGCAACAKACPAGIDIRDGLQMACINCAECIDACTRMRALRDKGSLIGYHFGEPVREGSMTPDEGGSMTPDEGGSMTQVGEETATQVGEGSMTPDEEESMTPDEGESMTPDEGESMTPLRINVLIMLLASLVFLGLLVNGVMTRADFSASLRLEPQFSPRIAGGWAVSAYRLSIKNRLDAEAGYTISSTGFVLNSRDDLSLPPGGAGSFIIYASFDVRGGLMPPDMITIEVKALDGVDQEVMGGGMSVSAAFPPSKGNKTTGGDQVR